jgi:protein-tyrosine-phosphatase
MKVLFECMANAGRSQVARACFDQLSQHDSDSAGLGVDRINARRNLSSRKLKDFLANAGPVEYIRKAFGVDISDGERQQLTPEMVDAADLVILIVEKERWPDYLQEGGKVVFWDIPDAFRQDDNFAAAVFRQVHNRVEQLVNEIG